MSSSSELLEFPPIATNKAKRPYFESKIKPPTIPEDSYDTSYHPEWKNTQKLIASIEETLGCRVITFFIPMDSSLTEDEVSEVANHLHAIGSQKKLALVIYGPGGSGIAAYRLVSLLRTFAEELTILVPDLAASALTMLTLGANEILTGPLTAFSPIDTSLSNHPLAPKDTNGHPVTVEITQVRKYLEFIQSSQFNSTDDFSKSPFSSLSEKVHPIFLGSIQRTLSLSKLLTESILKTHVDDLSKIETIVTKLNDAYPSHSYPILPHDFLSLGLNVKEMGTEQIALTSNLIEYYKSMTKWGEKVTGDSKEVWKTHTIIESKHFKSYYYMTGSEILKDKSWVRSRSIGGFERAVVVRSKKGFYEVRITSTNQFREWLDGKEITLD